ncbi:MAG: hypothetical protein E6Q97_09575 [Desulfurellales bacterium]|nr:MAG: hypothetical protein E6Q97_09575 [Desulfurellales bacterium]
MPTISPLIDNGQMATTLSAMFGTIEPLIRIPKFIKRFALALIAGLSFSLCHAEATKTIYNPFTGKLDFITALTTNSVTSSGCISITTTTAGFFINSAGCGGGSGSPIEVFSNFDATRSSPTLSFSIGDSMFLGVSGSTAVLNVDISSVTFGLISASSVSANYITISSVSANFLTQSSATANYLTISSSGNFLTTSSASATYFPLISSTTLLTTSSATANFLTLSSATATYFQIASTVNFVSQSSATTNLLSQSSATATYLQIASSQTFMSQSSATANFLTQSSASATYFPIISSTTLLTTSSATANFLTLSSGAATYFQINSSNTFIQNRNTLQPGATFFVSSGTANTFNFTTLNGAPWGSANLVPYLNGANVLTTEASFFYLDFLDILFAPSILGTTQMGSAYGAPVVMYDDDLSNFVGFESSGTMTTDTVYTLPNAAGSANQVWVLDGSNKFQNKYVNQVMKYTQWFNAEQAKLPTTSPCVISNQDTMRVPALLCDASTDESISWSGYLTPYTTTQMSAQVWYTMASANSGNVVHNLQVACASTTFTGTILDNVSFGAISASTITVPSVAGRIGVATMTVLNTNYPCRANDIFMVKYTRDANASADTASGDIQLRKILIYEP